MSNTVRRVALVAVSVMVVASCTRAADSTGDATLPTVSAESTTADPSGESGESGESSELTEGSESGELTETSESAVTTVDATASTVAGASTSAPPTTRPANSPPTTKPANSPPTTKPATTPTTTKPATTPDDLELNFDGVLPFAFGEHDVEVVAGLTKLLGAPSSDVSTEYPNADDGYFLDAAREQSYVFPHGRAVCYDNSLCVQFGAGATETLLFTGWTLTTDAEPLLTMANGIAVGSSLADHVDDVVIADGGCYSIGYGDSEGVAVVLQSAGEPFLSFADNGNAIVGDPDPDDVTLIELSAGQSPTFVFADC
jgi:hypothetical protein